MVIEKKDRALEAAEHMKKEVDELNRSAQYLEADKN